MIKYVTIKNKETNYKIKCKLFIPDGELSGCFIMCHGFASSKDSRSVRIISEKLLSKNIMSISFDFPMHGDSEKNRNNLLTENCVIDVTMVYNYIKRKYHPQYISIFGVSFGGYIAILNSMMTANKYKHIFLRAPAIGIGDIFMKHIAKEDEKILNKKGYIKSGFSMGIESTKEFIDGLKKYDLLKTKNFTHDCIIFHGSDDDTVPIENSYAFKRNNKSAKIDIVEIKGVRHVMDNETISKIADMIIKRI